MIIQWRICSHECFILYIVALEVMIEYCVKQSSVTLYQPYPQNVCTLYIKGAMIGAEGKGLLSFHKDMRK